MRRRGWLVSLDCTVCSSSSKQDNKVILSTYKFDIEKEKKEREINNDKGWLVEKANYSPGNTTPQLSSQFLNIILNPTFLKTNNKLYSHHCCYY
jgi:hypothetical protein